jgi:hypothetical protein
MTMNIQCEKVNVQEKDEQAKIVISQRVHCLIQRPRPGSRVYDVGVDG